MIMFSFLLIIIPLLSQNQVFSSPVLLWSNANLPQSPVPLSNLSPLDVISNQICELAGNEIQIRLFAVNELTNGEIQRGSQSQHLVLLDAKKEESQYRYFPNVDGNVYQTFSLIPQSNNMRCSRIHFRIASSEIYQTLHDALNAIQATIESIGTNSKPMTVMALIPGPVVHQSLTRQSRDIQSDEDDVLISDDRTCMFYAEELLWESGDDEKTVKILKFDVEKSECRPSSAAADNVTVTSVVLNLHWGNGSGDALQMSLNISQTGRFWHLDSVTTNETEYRYFAFGMPSLMDTPLAYSYVCTTAMFVKYTDGAYHFKNRFYIKKLQFQPFHGNGLVFGPPNYCTSFFTSGIWMGITTSLLCVGIALFGIYRMMAIKSNDRLDDPKGRPLVIKAQE